MIQSVAGLMKYAIVVFAVLLAGCAAISGSGRQGAFIGDGLPSGASLYKADLVESVQAPVDAEFSAPVHWDYYDSPVPCSAINAVHYWTGGGVTNNAFLILANHQHGGQYYPRPPSGAYWTTPALRVAPIQRREAEQLALFCAVKFVDRRGAPEQNSQGVFTAQTTLGANACADLIDDVNVLHAFSSAAKKREKAKLSRLLNVDMDVVDDILAENERGLLRFFSTKEAAAKKWARDFGMIHFVAFFGREEFIDAIVRAGADVNMESRGGFVPLHFAAASGLSPSIQALIKHGADVNAMGGVIQMTPLHFAADGGKKTAAVALINAGAKVNIKVRRTLCNPNATDETPADTAERKGHAVLAAFLREVEKRQAKEEQQASKDTETQNEVKELLELLN